MNNQAFYAGILTFSMINGIFSPIVPFVFATHVLWYPAFMPAVLPLVFFFSSLFVATLTVMVTGIPAAFYERLAGEKYSETFSAWIWLSGTAILSLPAVIRAVSML